MKKLALVGLILLMGVVTAVTFAQTGGGFDLTWSTIDGGGGSSSGGDYALSGTIGQPDAGELSGGGYALNGGFWQSVYGPLTFRILLPLIKHSSPLRVSLVWIAAIL